MKEEGEMFCSFCGKELPNDASFCLQCGKPQNCESKHQEIIQFLSYSFSSRSFQLRSNDEQIAKHALGLLKPVVKIPDNLRIEFTDGAWSLSYYNRRFFSDDEYAMIQKAALIHEYALVNGWIAEPVRVSKDNHGEWSSTSHSYTRKIIV